MRYSPGDVPVDPDNMPQFLVEELRRIAAAFEEVENILLVELHSEPAKPREGLVVLADGTNWNPGSGSGFYGYRDGAWRFLG